MEVVATYRGEFRATEMKGVTWVGCDLADVSAVRDLASRYNVDACIHCAAISNEAYARPNPLDAINTNVGATANLLDVAKQGAWQRFVLVSSGSVFQLRRDIVNPITEDQPPEPANVYSYHEGLRRTADADVPHRVRPLGFDRAHLVGVRPAGDQPSAAARADPVVSVARAAWRGDPRGRRGLLRELHLRGGCRGSIAGCGERTRAAPCDLSFRPWRQLHRWPGCIGSDEGRAGRDDRIDRRHRALDADTPRCAARSPATGSCRIRATSRRTRSTPASRPMLSGCGRIRACGGRQH